MGKWGVVLALSLVILTPAQAVPGASDSRPAIRDWIPSDAVVVLEVKRPAALLDTMTSDEMVNAVTSSPAYQKQMQTDKSREFIAIVRYLEAKLNTDWQTGLRKLLGGGVTLAVLPGDAVLLGIDAEDPALLQQLHEIMLNFVRDEAGRQGQAERVKSVDYRGITGWTFGGSEAHVLVDGRLLMTNKPDLLKRVLDLSLQSGSSLATLPDYQAAQEAAGSDVAATLYVNMQALRQHPPFRQALETRDNPLGTLLFADVMEALRKANWLTMGLQADRDLLTLRAVTDANVTADSGPSVLTGAAGPDAAAGSLIQVPRQVAGLSLFRDLYAFYAAKDELFPNRTSGLIFFENMMGIFFSGRDLTEEVLAETTPDIRIVVAEQEYDAQIGTPRVRIPAFAAVFRLRDPENYQIVAEEAWQKALGLVNFTRGQQGLPGLIIDRFTHADVKFTTAYFSDRNVENRTALETRYNLRPSLAMFDDYMILSSTEQLARDLIDAIKNPQSSSAAMLDQAHSLLQLQGFQLSSILRSNQQQMIRDNMIKKGQTEEQARGEIETLLTLLEHLDQLRLEIGTRQNQPQAVLQLRVQ